MQILKSKKEDIQEIVNIINEAKLYFKNNNIKQWESEYPNEKNIEQDILNDCSYVLKSDNKILGTFYLYIGEDKSYNENFKGIWFSNGIYATIHRMAILEKEKGKGLGKKIIKFCELICRENNINSLRVDTDEDNIPMLNFIEKNGFEKCGIISWNGKEKIAFEKILK